MDNAVALNARHRICCVQRHSGPPVSHRLISLVQDDALVQRPDTRDSSLFRVLLVHQENCTFPPQSRFVPSRGSGRNESRRDRKTVQEFSLSSSLSLSLSLFIYIHI